MKLGDQNTRYFDQKANRRQRKNCLYGLFDDNVGWHEDKKGMEEIIVQYFLKLFDSQGQCDASKILDHVVPKVTAGVNDELLLPYSNEDIKFALFQMNPTKASGLEGMSLGFYYKH